MFADGQDNGLWNAEVLAKAARGGHLECLKYLRDECGCAWDARTCAAAASGGHVEVLSWAVYNNGTYKDGCPWDESACAAAVSGGHLNELQWLRREGCPWDHATAHAAMEYGRSEGDMTIWKWAQNNGCPGT